MPMPTLLESPLLYCGDSSDSAYQVHSRPIIQKRDDLRSRVAGSAASSDTSSQSHSHRESTSSLNLDSASTSPSTTGSVAEFASSNGTPVTSPDTPASAQSLNSVAPSLASPARSEGGEPLNRQPVSPDLPRPSSAPKRPRNLKNLAVDTSSATAFGRALNTAALPLQLNEKRSNGLSHDLVGAPTPGFLKPLNFPKKKSSLRGLTIVTPGLASGAQEQSDDPTPPTPSLRRPLALRHFPSLPTLTVVSPTGAPEGGMCLPPLATTRDNIPVGFHEAPQEKDEDDPHRFDIPQSMEEKSNTYPDGPICIYDPHVYLYYEPTAEQASQFDVVMNVAREVKNPFAITNPEHSPSPAAPSDNEILSPSTPKASSPLPIAASAKTPEYFHILWDHNTDIVPDLYDLVQKINDRVHAGQRILIHCQCGVSRSASLIVAYGLFLNPSITVQEAYDAVKRRSKWIGPNMSLIMQLQEFRTILLKRSSGMPTKGRFSVAMASSNGIKSPDGTQLLNNRRPSADDVLPKSAPLIPESQHINLRSPPFSAGSRPSSAPSGVPWPTAASETSTADTTPKAELEPERNLDVEPPRPVLAVPEQQEANADAPPLSESTPSPPLPLSHISRFQAKQMAVPAVQPTPRSSEFAMAPVLPPTPDENFGLTSPRPTTLDPFHGPHAQAQLPIEQMSSLSVMPSESEGSSVAPMPPPTMKPNFGLSSIGEGRSNLFQRRLPRSNSKSTAYTALHPDHIKPLATSPEDADARAKLRSELGMSTRSSYDLRSEYVSAAKAKALAPLVSPQRETFFLESHDDLSDALMSPRATEQTSNPFHNHTLLPGYSQFGKSTKESDPAPAAASSSSSRETDPRSPPQKGVSPIVRNIADFL